MSDQSIAEIKKLLNTETLPAIGPTRRADALSETALNAKLDARFRATSFSGPRPELIRALLLLWHDHLDASHNISQGIETADGSFVHALMHRREPDYWNAKYWWRRVGAHPAFPEIARQTAEFLSAPEQAPLKKQLLSGNKWNADAFVDLCEQATSDPRHVELLQQVQRIETEVLLDSFLHQ